MADDMAEGTLCISTLPLAEAGMASLAPFSSFTLMRPFTAKMSLSMITERVLELAVSKSKFSWHDVVSIKPEIAHAHIYIIVLFITIPFSIISLDCVF